MPSAFFSPPLSQSKSPSQKSKNAPPRILFFTRILPQHGTSGAGVYAADILEHLKRNSCDIRVVWTETPDRYRYTFYNTLPHEHAGQYTRYDIRPKDCMRVGRHLFNHRALWLPRKARALYFLKRLLQRLRLFPARHHAHFNALQYSGSSAILWDTPCTPGEREFLYTQAADYKPDILIVNYPWMLAGLERKHTAPQHWVLTNDYRFRRSTITPDGHYTQNYTDPAARAAEQKLLSAADLLIAIQQNEASTYAADHPGKPIITACMSIGPAAALAQNFSSAPATTTHAQRPICGFIASNNTVNREAAHWLVTQVWPQILAAKPRAHLRIAGRICDTIAELKNRPPNIELLGPIADLDAYYAGLTIALIPLLEGSGVKTKLLEPIARRCAAITTNVGLDGLEIFAPALAIADTPDDFAAAALSLLDDHDRREHSADQALALARQHLSPNTCYNDLLRAIHSTVSIN